MRCSDIGEGERGGGGGKRKGEREGVGVRRKTGDIEYAPKRNSRAQSVSHLTV